MTKINGIEDQTTFTLSNTQDFVYKFLRSLCQSQQILPSYSGFISTVNDPPKSLTKIVYYSVIQKPITEYSTVQVLRYSEEASNEVGQSIVITKKGKTSRNITVFFAIVIKLLIHFKIFK